MAKDPRIKRRVIVVDGRRLFLIRCEAPIDQAIGPLAIREMGYFEDDGTKHTIAWRALGTIEDKRTILHELIHYAEKKTKARISEKSMRVLDKSIFEALDGFGVDLSPLLEGYE